MKKQLLFVINHLTVGGIQKTLISALKVIDYEKYDVTVYLRKNRTDLLPFIDKRVNVIINNDANKYYRKPRAIWLQLLIEIYKLTGKKEKAEKTKKELSELINQYCMKYEHNTFFADKKFDTAIAYANGYPAYFVADYIKADEKVIFFHTSTNDLPDVHKKFISKYNKAVAVHDRLIPLISEWHPCLEGKISVIENYVDTDTLKKQASEKSVATPEGKTVLCSCGRFAPVKGFDMAVESARILKNNNVDFIWYFVGDGSEKDKLLNLTEKYKLSDNIIFTGMQKNPYPYMDACDIYVQPSYEEAWGLTIAEAHRLGKPVVTTATVGGRKLVKNGKSGIVCDINSESITESITNLINDKKLYTNIIYNLESTDYSHEFEKYNEQWSALLEG
ncbi:MAG: glycosyltransferase [Clostridia bacterium]|nr:glycosyltransferase [Clostridia bacterium]